MSVNLIGQKEINLWIITQLNSPPIIAHIKVSFKTHLKVFNPYHIKIVIIYHWLDIMQNYDTLSEYHPSRLLYLRADIAHIG